MTWVWDSNATKRRMSSRAERRLRDAMRVPRLRAQAGLPRAVPPSAIYHVVASLVLHGGGVRGGGEPGTASSVAIFVVLAAMLFMLPFAILLPNAGFLLLTLEISFGVIVVVASVTSYRSAHQKSARVARWRGVLVAEHGECLACDYRIADIAPDAEGRIVCPECGAAWKLGTADPGAAEP